MVEEGTSMTTIRARLKLFHSGLAVEPNNNNDEEADAKDAIFGMAKAATGDDKEQVRRTITMVRCWNEE